MLVRDARLAAIVAARDRLSSASIRDETLLREINRRIEAYLLRRSRVLEVPDAATKRLFEYDDDDNDVPTPKKTCVIVDPIVRQRQRELAQLDRAINMLRRPSPNHSHGILRDADSALVVCFPPIPRVVAPTEAQMIDGRVGLLQRTCRAVVLREDENINKSAECPMCLESLTAILDREGELVRVDPACSVCTSLRKADHDPKCALAVDGACLPCMSETLARAWQRRDKFAPRDAFAKFGSAVPCPLCRGTICEDDLLRIVRT